MKKLINWVKNKFKKPEPVKTEFEKKIDKAKDMIERIEVKKDISGVSNNDISVFDKEQHKFVGIGGEAKKVILQKVQNQLSKKPELFVAEELTAPQKPETKKPIATDKKIIELPTGEQKVVPVKKKYNNSKNKSKKKPE